MNLTSKERAERTVMSLEMALKAAVYRHNDDSLMAYIAEKNAFNINTFRSSLSPTTPTHKANIYHLEAVLSETKDARIMDSICAIHGNAAWFELPRVEVLSSADFILKVGKLAHENGDLVQSIVAAIEDKVITDDELAVIRKEAYDLIRIAATLLAMAELHHAGGDM
ncbi:phage regulatory CII family protein [Acinetobacter ursingii]|uniref:phage regulatory CII family protein n=1 Tax=Acinetobacter ursingii TaxID=108980 RepID=UPI001250C417|nr:phage regulatory CII family protein [Acinetobacter ursingii]MCU4496347.1 Rha family transcriptional regulator [Acinetobacter ursingii]UYF78260.1 Rha family transcriptional regulator [Acinetobacter ursingii]